MKSAGPVLAAAMLGLAAAPALALNGGDERVYVCEKGDCRNGQGSARSAISHVLVEGPWRNGQSIAGESYALSHPVRPEQRYRATYAADGLQDSGDTLFNPIMGRALAVYSGTYAHVDHPFGRIKVAVPKRGTLDNGLGLQYSGRFEYLPGRTTMDSYLASGTYIFFGTVVDSEDGTRETGLYLSNEQPNSFAPQFFKANAAFLAKLQRKYQVDLEIAKVEWAERDASMRWREALAVVGKIAMGLATGGTSAAMRGLASETAMNLVNGMMQGDDAKFSIEDATNKAIQQAAGGDEDAARQMRDIVRR